MNICYSYLYLKSLGIEADLKPTETIIKDHLFKPHPWKDGVSGNKLEKMSPTKRLSCGGGAMHYSWLLLLSQNIHRSQKMNPPERNGQILCSVL